MRYRELIEAPVTDFALHGGLDTLGSFRQDDLKNMRSEEWRGRVIKILAKCPFDIGLYLVNGDENKKVVRKGKTWIDRIDTAKPTVYVGLQSPEWAETILGKLPAGYEKRVNVMLLNNEGSDRVGLTPWIVPHRMAHRFLKNNPRAPNERLRSLGTSAGSAVQSMMNEFIDLFIANSSFFEAIGLVSLCEV